MLWLCVFYIELFPTEDGFSLTVEVDGRGISDFPDCEVMLPVSWNRMELSSC